MDCGDWDSAEVHLAAGTYTRSLLISTSAVLVSETFWVQFVTSYDPSIY
jgi:hypothetical protein